jgi:hypothetical protein
VEINFFIETESHILPIQDIKVLVLLEAGLKMAV